MSWTGTELAGGRACAGAGAGAGLPCVFKDATTNYEFYRYYPFTVVCVCVYIYIYMYIYTHIYTHIHTIYYTLCIYTIH